MKVYPFLQKVSVLDEEIPIEQVLSCAYIELADIGGTKLILTLADQAAIYRDTMKIQQGTEIELVLSDMSGGDEELWNDQFIVAKASSPDGQTLKIECFQKQCASLKKLAIQPIFINEQKPREVLAKLLPDFTIECDEFPTLGTYHLNAGGTKSNVLRVMARDYAAICYFSRGTLYFKDPKRLLSEEPELKLEYCNSSAEHVINKYQILGQEGNCGRIVDRAYYRWNGVTGLQLSVTHQNESPVIVSVPNQQALNSQATVLLPVIDVELAGFGGYQPALNCGLVFHRQLPEVAQDESIPKNALITQVTHYQHAYHYQCKLQLGVIHE